MEMVTDKEALENLAENLRSIMEKRDLTQQDLERLSGVQQSAISRILNAKNDPSICAVRRLADALGFSVDALLAKPVGKILETAS